MDDDGLPRIAGLSGPELARAALVAMHSPEPAGPAALTWTVTVLSDGDEPLAESRATSPDYPVPLSEIVQPHLDVAGLIAVGGWRAVPTEDGSPRFCIRVRLREGG